jgi:hypothetical protein
MKGRRSILIASVFSILMATVKAAEPQTVSVTDYKAPVSRAQSFFVDFNSSYSMKGKSITSERGNLGLTYKRFYDSLPFGYSMDVIGSFSLEGKEDKEMEIDYLYDARFKLKKYISGDLFSSLKLHQSYLEAYDRPAVDITLSLGYGRFIDATPLAKAVRIEDFLIKEKVLSDRMPKESVLALAEIIGRRREYQERFGPIYRERWYEDMERVIQESGRLIGRHISAIGVLRMQEVLTRERITDRVYGWDLSAGVKQGLVTPRRGMKPPSPALDLSAHYARPLGWRIVWSEEVVFNSPFGRDFLDEYRVSITSLFAYELANKIGLNINHLLDLSRLSPDRRLAVNNLLNIVFIFYIENKLNLVLTERISKSEGEKAKTSFVMALNYRVF